MRRCLWWFWMGGWVHVVVNCARHDNDSGAGRCWERQARAGAGAPCTKEGLLGGVCRASRVAGHVNEKWRGHQDRVPWRTKGCYRGGGNQKEEEEGQIEGKTIPPRRPMGEKAKRKQWISGDGDRIKR